MKDYTPNPVIVARAVELWKRALENPTYSNSRPGDGTNPMPSLLADTRPRNNTPEVLTKFGEALYASLMDENTDPWEATRLRVDYQPDDLLASAAKAAGLKMQFPWKTTMYIGEDCVEFGVGYGAKLQRHYPLSGNRWLVTDLRGADIEAVIAAVEAGNTLGLMIEEAPANTEQVSAT